MNRYEIEYWQFINADDQDLFFKEVEADSKEEALENFKSEHRLARHITIKELKA